MASSPIEKVQQHKSTCAKKFLFNIKHKFVSSEPEYLLRYFIIWGTDLQEETIGKVNSKLRLAVALFARTVLPAVIGVYYAYLRNQKSVVENVRRQVLPTIVAFLANSISRSLSSVQRGISYPLSFRQIQRNPSITETDESPDKCVECLVLFEPTEPIRADVIFIHGLHGSLFKTWRQGTWRHERHKLKDESVKRGIEIMEIRRNSWKRVNSDLYQLPYKITRKDSDFFACDNENEEVLEKKPGDYALCWPQNWLPIDCPGVRVIALNYTTDPYLWRPLWIKKRNRTSMVERSKEMINLLLEKGVGQQPIVWVGHSKGGLFIKQMIVDSFERNWIQYGLENIYKQTKAIMFYSVPHRGSYLADVTLPLLSRSIELIEIQRNCPFVLDLHRRFLKVFEDVSFNPEIFSFIETSFTFMTFLYLKIVAFDSADPGVGNKQGVPLDHREICKPAGRDCFLYLELVKLIESVFLKLET